jgi:hypothetical protein
VPFTLRNIEEGLEDVGPPNFDGLPDLELCR